jgi:hypothetical protein
MVMVIPLCTAWVVEVGYSFFDLCFHRWQELQHTLDLTNPHGSATGVFVAEEGGGVGFGAPNVLQS